MRSGANSIHDGGFYACLRTKSPLAAKRARTAKTATIPLHRTANPAPIRRRTQIRKAANNNCPPAIVLQAGTLLLFQMIRAAAIKEIQNLLLHGQLIHS